MIVNVIFLPLLFGLQYLTRSGAVVYYITPAGNCTMDGTVLSPCHTLPHLIHQHILFEVSHQSGVELIFLPGRHKMPGDQLVVAPSLNELEFRPLQRWQGMMSVVIQCQVEDSYALNFHDIIQFRIFSIHFEFCSFSFAYETTNFVSIYLVNSVFERSEENWAIVIEGTTSGTDVSVVNNVFLHNAGAIHSIPDAVESVHLVITETVFQGNGGVSVLDIENTVLELRRSQFTNNTGRMNGAIRAEDSSLAINDTKFINNYAHNSGGSVFLLHSSANIHRCHFMMNYAGGDGGAINVPELYSMQSVSIRSSVFKGNHAGRYGGALHILGSQSSLTNCQFVSNSADSGGAIFIKGEEKELNIKNTHFLSNDAKLGGGAITCQDGAFIHMEGGQSVSNSALHGRGGFVYLSDCELHMSGYRNLIRWNVAVEGGAIFAVNSIFGILDHATVIANNTAKNFGGAVYLSNSIIGGRSIVTFTHNVVTSNSGKGGAIFISDVDCERLSYHPCFFKPINDSSKRFIFLNNSASEGSILYGGLLDRCEVDFRGSNGLNFTEHIVAQHESSLAVTSDPVRVCLCSDEFKVNCTARRLEVTKMRGEVIEIIGAVVDQGQMPKNSYLRAVYAESEAELGKGEGRKEIGNKCSRLSYHVFTSSPSATLFLHSEGTCERSEFSQITVHIAVVPCSRGLEEHGDRCDCERRLKDFNITDCRIGLDTIKRKGPIWLSYDEQHLKVHANCPLDYCHVISDTISLVDPDEQCANHHSKVICGACQDNYSIALGNSKCIQCTSSYAFVWLIPAFVVIGMALVALLLLCNMTISHGTLNGLIFYANVVSASGLTNLQNCSIHPILSVFIAWVNLDFGIETCFFSGMDIYKKTWLQFAFPLYIWLLVGAIILASYYSSTAMKVFGRNNVAILATLFLLSYTKILKTIVTALSSTDVLKADAANVSDQLIPYKVWTYDGNVEYLKGKHIPLFAVALMFLIFLFLPYTLMLTFGQCIRSMDIKIKFFSRCIHSIVFISVMDAYHAPYKKKHRYWTGLMLLTRCILFLAFTSSYGKSELLSHTYITTLTAITIFIIKMTVAIKVYVNFYIEILELCYIVNLVILSSTLYYLGSGSVVCKCTAASVSCSMVIFFGILFYHCYLRISQSKHLNVICLKQLTSKICTEPVSKKIDPPSSGCTQPTTTNIELREALLDSGECH